MEDIDYSKIDEIFTTIDKDLEYVDKILKKAKKALEE